MECRCGSQDGEYKQGISKKNGKPWRGWKCNQCNEMQFLRAETTKTQPTTQSSDQVTCLLKRNNELLAKILAALSNKTSIEPEELKPDEDSPF